MDRAPQGPARTDALDLTVCAGRTSCAAAGGGASSDWPGAKWTDIDVDGAAAADSAGVSGGERDTYPMLAMAARLPGAPILRRGRKIPTDEAGGARYAAGAGGRTGHHKGQHGPTGRT